MLVQTILENESGLSERIPNNLDFFHTPNTTGMDGGSNSRKALKKRMEKWPTPTASDWMSPKQNGIELKNNRFIRTSLTTGMKFGAKLSDAVNLNMKQKFPTPQSNDAKNAVVRHRTKSLQVMLGGAIATLDTQAIGGHLNPMWVEWLMGWPLGWTDLKPLEMDKFHYVSQPLGDY
jgi:DNA (cytosine-5)-methyltransferase 1